MGKKRTGRYPEVELMKLIAARNEDEANLEKAEAVVRSLTALEQRWVRLSLGTLEEMLERSLREWEAVRDTWFPEPKKPEAVAAKAAGA